MTLARVLIASLILPCAAPARAADENADWAMFERIVAVVQPFLRLAAQSEDPRAVARSIESALAGENAEVNRLARDLAAEMFEDMPAQLRGNVQALLLDAAALARKERERSASSDRAVQARKDLAAIGLRYNDAAQFLDAVKRDDALAVELYVIGRGVNLAARDADGRSALEIARDSRNRTIVRLLESAG